MSLDCRHRRRRSSPLVPRRATSQTDGQSTERSTAMPSTASVRRAQKAERENTKKTEALSKAKKDADDAYWAAAGDGKKSKAAQRADAAAASADAKAAARAEARRQAQLEEEAFAGGKKGPAKKVTAFELQQGKEMDAKARLRAKFAAKKVEQKIQDEDEYDKTVMRENENRSVGVVSGSGMDAALEALTIGERSASPAPLSGKAAYAAFEEENLPALKAEKPGLRKTQYADLLSKLWARSPQNPQNQKK